MRLHAASSISAQCSKSLSNSASSLNSIGRCIFRYALPEVNNLPNDETIAAMKEVDEMRKHPEQYPSFTSVDGMFDALLKSEDSDEVHSPI